MQEESCEILYRREAAKSIFDRGALKGCGFQPHRRSTARLAVRLKAVPYQGWTVSVCALNSHVSAIRSSLRAPEERNMLAQRVSAG
jgi:hypothetical protein